MQNGNGSPHVGQIEGILNEQQKYKDEQDAKAEAARGVKL